MWVAKLDEPGARQGSEDVTGLEQSAWEMEHLSSHRPLVYPQFFPQGIHATFGLVIHANLLGPGAGKAFGGPLAGGVNAHFGAEIRQAGRVVERVHWAESELDVA